MKKSRVTKRLRDIPLVKMKEKQNNDKSKTKKEVPKLPSHLAMWLGCNKTFD